MNCAIIIIF